MNNNNVLEGKIILLTGGTGSFGKYFTKVVLEKYAPKVIRIYSRDELKQYEMQKEFSDRRLRFFIGDVRDKERLTRAMTNVDIVVHAAALKQVPSCEYNPFEAVKTNVLGAMNVIDTAIDNKVKKVIAISTDKAVSPVNLYGATKLTAEKLFIQGNSYVGKGATKFSCVRYGNVIGSRGSVIPLFMKQKEKGVLTITDERMTRFWITLKQGVEFVIECISKMHGGEIFVPKIPSMKIVDLAKVIAPECTLKITGIRPGEKVYETLLTEEEARHSVELDGFFVIEPEFPWWNKKNWKNGKRLPDNFSYNSNNNGHWLSGEELREMFGKVRLTKN